MAEPQTSYKLVTVNNVPERANVMIGRLVEALKDRYTIIHAANAESKSVDPTLCSEHRVDVL